MIEFFAVTLAAFMVPSAPLTNMSERYPEDRESTVYVQRAIDPGLNPQVVRTPNGTEVEAIFPNEQDTSTLNYENGLMCDYFYDVDNTSIVSIKAQASYTYNGFAYAFHMQYGGSACWIEKIYPYTHDGSFVEVPTPQEGDIVCYCAGDKEINAGIIKAVYPQHNNEDMGSNLLVESKWHQYGVFEHRGDLCPYFAKYNILGLGFADNLVYYRRHETHNYKVVTGSDNGTTHTLECSECGAIATENHKYSYTKINSLMHKATCVCGKVINSEALSWIPYSDPLLTGPYTYVKCKHCLFIKKLAPGEFVPIIKSKKDLLCC